MRSLPVLFTTDCIEHVGTMFTAPRPLPGDRVAWLGQSGFAIYDVFTGAWALRETEALDGQAIHPVTEAEWEAIVLASLVADGWRASDFDDDADRDAPLTAAHLAVQGITIDEAAQGLDWAQRITLTPIGTR